MGTAMFRTCEDAGYPPLPWSTLTPPSTAIGIHDEPVALNCQGLMNNLTLSPFQSLRTSVLNALSSFFLLGLSPLTPVTAASERTKRIHQQRSTKRVLRCVVLPLVAAELFPRSRRARTVMCDSVRESLAQPSRTARNETKQKNQSWPPDVASRLLPCGMAPPRRLQFCHIENADLLMQTIEDTDPRGSVSGPLRRGQTWAWTPSRGRPRFVRAHVRVGLERRRWLAAWCPYHCLSHSDVSKSSSADHTGERSWEGS